MTGIANLSSYPTVQVSKGSPSSIGILLANLDSETGSRLLDMMKDLNERTRMTFVFSTHDPMIMKRARRLIVLKDGEITKDEKRA